jgi:3-oxoacyl-[acyl-carrier protein] reductase
VHDEEGIEFAALRLPPACAVALDRLDELAVGQVDQLTRTITDDDVAAFSRLTGDHNALHTDDEFAARTSYGKRVAHGFLHASLLSTLIGMKMPGRGALYLSQSFDFAAPVFIGDTLTVRGRIEKKDVATRTLTIRTSIINQHGAMVLDGVARVKVMRLTVAGPEKRGTMSPQFSDRLLAGKTALVTGASRGIGRAIATALSDHGARLVVNYHMSEQAASSLVAAIEERGGQAIKVKANVAEPAEAARLVEVAAREGLDILVNNAGPKIASGSLETFAWSDMQQAFEQIVGGVFNVMRAAIPALRARQGRIVNIASSAALGRTAHGWLPYVTAKAALFGMSKNLAQEFGPAGVRVNMVSPSLVSTDLTADVPDRIRQMVVSRTPLRRLASPQDVAGAVLFLVSPYADFVTGENLLVAGGDIMI